MTILEKIVAHKRLEVAQQKAMHPLPMLVKEVEVLPNFKSRSLAESLVQSTTGIIAEFKRKSPSKGWISSEAEPASIAEGYEQAGATAVSVLTDAQFFGGSEADFLAARKRLSIPMLRKDFVVDEYQIYEAKRMGADAVLLIAAALSADEVQRFGSIAHELGLETLLEIHAEDELRYVKLCKPWVDVVGVNNRNLATFATTVETSMQLADKIAADVKISESGISMPATVAALRKKGYRGFLMGENFMKTPHPANALHKFICEAAALSGGDVER